LLQKLHRDTQKFAFKCSHALVGGVGRDVVKDPITDPGKKSKMGRLTLERSGDEWTTITEGRGDCGKDELIEVFRDGALLVDHTFAAIRARSTGELVATERLSVPRTLGVKKDPLNNILMLTDSYKVSHHLQYPPGTETIYSYFESRGGAHEDVVFFGLQYFMRKYLMGEVVTMGKIDQAEAYFKVHFSQPGHGYTEGLFNRKSWEYIVEKHGGRLPISIKAVPEGTVIPYRNVLFTLENTDPECFWLTNYLETLLVQVWYATTVCTQSREQKKIIMKGLQETGCGDVIDNDGHLFKLHDFGFRGVSSVESAAVGSVGHLVNFLGSDTLVGLMLAKDHYFEPNAGYSVPASEHSTMTSWGRAGEVEAYRNMLTKYPTGVVSIVSDSYDVFNACENLFGGELREMIEMRGGRLVVRPDSGELPTIILDVLDKLASKFPCTTTSTGHKLLPDYIRVLQGDGINIDSLAMIIAAMKDAGWAADNLAFGSGGALLQKLHRDTQKFAFKCSYALVGGVGRDVVKDPITDPGKKSKMGRLTLERAEDGEFITVVEGKGDPEKDLLVEVFRDVKCWSSIHWQRSVREPQLVWQQSKRPQRLWMTTCSTTSSCCLTLTRSRTTCSILQTHRSSTRTLSLAVVPTETFASLDCSIS
jgi:nicotinamide phosphoribosyltransferase